MGYIDKEEILEKTNGGLDIIISYYPDAANALQRRDKKFKAREEKTASASIKQLPDGNYIVTDFGGDGTPRNAIGVCMFEEGLEFQDALSLLAGRFGIDPKELEKTQRPDISYRPAKKDEKEGVLYWEAKDFEEHELKVLGPLVKPELCEKYSLKALKSHCFIKDGQATVFSSNENYPILLFEFGAWRKLYQPNSVDKKYRFRHGGERPKDYMFGLDVCKKAFDDLNADFDPESDDSNQKRMKKLPEIIICSGDRDALNVASMGYQVVWLNSESAEITPGQMLKLNKYAYKVLNLPDLDATGQKQGHIRAMKFLDMYTIDLPKELLARKDWRGNPCKDVTDYLKYFPIRNFKALVVSAMRYQMWDEIYKGSGETKSIDYKFNHAHTYYFLQKNGFHRLRLPNNKQGYTYIRIDGNVVKEVSDVEIKSFVNNFLRNLNQKTELRNLFYRSQNNLAERSLSNLDEIEIDFTDYTKSSQFLFFKNTTWEITPNEIKEHKPGMVDRYVWEDEIIDHKVKVKEPPFKIQKNEDGEYNIEIIRKDCLFFQYLIQTSRIHWQKEDEQKIPLTRDEINEQNQHLINKIYALGYLLHRYKDPNRPWCVFAMDNKISDTGESHGGSGKSIAMKSVRYFMKYVTLEGRNSKLTENQHLYENVTQHTDYILIDDANQYLNFDFFFSALTGEMTVNPKHGKQYVIPFQDVPKLAITSNFTLRNLDPSTERRLLYIVFSDYFHFNKDEEYQESRSPYDEFGKNLFLDFTEEEWEEFFNFMAHCIQTYLNYDKIDPPMQNVTQRNLRTIMTDLFKDWADVYFSNDSERLNTEVIKSEAFDDFKDNGGKNWKPTWFKKSLKAWCTYYGFELNPEILCGTDGRIIKKNSENKAVEHIFIRTKPLTEIENERREDLDAADF